MLNDAIAKGTYGYIDYKKKNLTIKWLVCGLICAAFVIAGLIIFKSKLNLLMVPGMLMVLPFANFMASFLAIVSYRTAPAEKYSMVRNYDDAGMLLSDMVVVNDKGKRMFAEFAVIYRNGVVMYASSTKWKPYEMEVLINDKLKHRGLTLRLKVYNDFDEFLSRIDGLELPEDETSKRRIELTRETITGVCM